MKKGLLLVTDHRFFKHKGVIYDNYVFNYSFFKDYLEVFDSITVIARVANLNNIKSDYQQASGKYVEFIAVKDIRGIKWLLFNDKFLKNSQIDLSGFSAICFRIPSALAFGVWKTNKKTFGRPHMFEFIGDPKEALINENDNFFKKKVYSFIGSLMQYRMKLITKSAVCGSYVSFNHLQNKYPVKDEVQTEVISSIRLNKKYIRDKLPSINTQEINIIHVGSFVFVKNHNFLIEFFKLLKDENFKVNLTLLGDGALIEESKCKAEQLGLQEDISFKGHITGFDNIIKYLDSNNVFILPSFSEGMPRALIEAMSRGLICFGSDRGGISELLEKDYLFEPTKPEIFFKNFKEIISNKELIEKSRKRNLQLATGFEQNLLTSKRKKILNILKSKTI
mgnify:CR=1 FL=1